MAGTSDINGVFAGVHVNIPATDGTGVWLCLAVANRSDTKRGTKGLNNQQQLVVGCPTGTSSAGGMTGAGALGSTAGMGSLLSLNQNQNENVHKIEVC